MEGVNHSCRRWSQQWQVLDSSPHSIHLAYQCQTVPIRVDKVLQLDAHGPEVSLTYGLQNQSDEEIPFLLKQHAAIAIEPGDEILLRECKVEPAFLEFSKIIGQPGKTNFPKAVGANGEGADLRVVPPPSSQLQEFYYSSDLASGVCGIFKTSTEGFEPPTPRTGTWCSIQLSYVPLSLAILTLIAAYEKPIRSSVSEWRC